MNFDYEITENKYGEKLAISFQYDPDVVDRIKSLPWEQTHRSWDPDQEAWLLDWTDESVGCFEQRMGVTVPGEFRPGEGYSGTIKLVVPDGYTWFFVRNPTQEIDRLLDSELSYFQPGAEYSDRYKSGMWDGYVHLYNTDNHGSSIGLLDRATELIEDLGFDVNVIVEGDRSGPQIETEWAFDHPLREYQKMAVNSAIANEGGVISFPTGSGKTVVGMRLIHEIGQKAIVFVHTKELLYQWADEIRDNLDVEPGLIGDGQWSEGPVTIAIMQTLLSRGTDDLDDYGTMIFDECHRTSAAEMMHEIGMNIDTEWRIGLSATPWRRTSGEEMKIEGAVGGVAANVSAEHMIDEGFLSKPEFEIIDPANFGEQATATAGEDFQDVYRRCIEFEPLRNRVIAKKASELARQGYSVLINVDRISQGVLLKYALSDLELPDAIDRADLDENKQNMFAAAAAALPVNDHNAEFLSSSDGTDHRQDVLEKFADNEIPILISTLIKEGVNIPSMNAVILAEGKKSDIAKIQTIGRALRPSNGDHAIIVDIEDRGSYLGSHFSQRMAAYNEYYGVYGPDGDYELEEDEPPERQNLSDPMTDEEEAQLAVDLGVVETVEDY